MVNTYNKSEGGKDLTGNFKVKEFACKCCRCTTVPVDDGLVAYLQTIREHFSARVTVTSGYRCPAHNEEVGGADHSYHTRGMAADFVVDGVAPAEVAKYAQSIGVLGIGLYEAADGNFVHIDTRDHKSFWYGHKQERRETFGDAVEPECWYRIREEWDKPETQIGAYLDMELAKKNCPAGYSVFDRNGGCVCRNGGRTPAEAYPLEEFVRDIQSAIGAVADGIPGPETIGKTVTISARKNPRHAAVKPVQQRLYMLGYEEVGKADGIAGPKFTSAVAHFQLDNGCWVDGEITKGNQTWRRLLGLGSVSE